MTTHYQIQESHVEIFVVGEFMGDTNFPAVEDLPSNLPWFIDLAGLKSLNSQGIRAWISWINQVSFLQIYFLNCPDFFIIQASQVVSMVPNSENIMSFRLSYYSDELGVGREKRFERKPGEKFQIPKVLEVITAGTTNHFELDHIPSKSLKCLLGQFELIDSSTESGN